MLYLALLISALMVTEPAESSDRASDFVLPTPSGGRVHLGSLLEKGPVLIDFWATWCKPCVKAMPKLQEIHEKYKDRGLTVLGINEDRPRGQAKVKPFLRSRKLTFVNGLDLDGGLLKRYRVSTLPATLLVDTDGEIVLRQSGYTKGKQMEERLIEAIESVLVIHERLDSRDR